VTNDVGRDVTAKTKDSQAENPDAPWRFSLRGKNRDRDIVQRVVQAHARMGINLSLNDAVLVLIRRAATPDADTQEEAWRQIEQHWHHCSHGCDVQFIKCPEGWRLRDAFHRVAKPGWRPPNMRPAPPRPSPAPPPPLPAAPAATEATRWRRYFGFERKAS
jgi:hypothetical protein